MSFSHSYHEPFPVEQALVLSAIHVCKNPTCTRAQQALIARCAGLFAVDTAKSIESAEKTSPENISSIQQQFFRYTLF